MPVAKNEKIMSIEMIAFGFLVAGLFVALCWIGCKRATSTPCCRITGNLRAEHACP